MRSGGVSASASRSSARSRGGVLEGGQQRGGVTGELRRRDADAALAAPRGVEQRGRLRAARRGDRRDAERGSALVALGRVLGQRAGDHGVEREPSRGGGSERCAQSLRSVPSSGNGTAPVSVKYSTQPSEYRSAAGPSPSPRMRSGAT